jgi:hypothetical protein
MEEVWAPIMGFPNYSLSSLGRVRNDRMNRLMRIYSHHGTHSYVLIEDAGGAYTKRYINDLMEIQFPNSNDRFSRSTKKS